MDAAGVKAAAGLALVACTLVVGCSGGPRQAKAKSPAHRVLGAGQPAGRWASDVELAWLRKLGVWDSRLLAGLRRAAQIESQPKLVRKLLQHDSGTILAHSDALSVASTCS